MSIAAQEKMKLTKEEALELIAQSGQDVRQTIYNLQMIAADGHRSNEQKDCAVVSKGREGKGLLNTR